MHSPLDRELAKRIGPVKAARLYSNIVSPPVMFAVLGLILALTALPNWQGWAWAAIYGFFISLLPILFVLYLLRNGYISELHMSNTRERHWPYISAVLSALFAYGLVQWLNGPPVLACLTLFNTIELAALGTINVFWLISLHSTAVGAITIIVGLVYGWGYALLLLPLVVSVCWVRLYLRRHTLGQVIAGLGLGVVSVLSLTLIGCW
jgi:membrane-associated phospholipid phosphatase